MYNIQIFTLRYVTKILNLLWLLGSIWFFYVNDPGMFQRFGALGVAFAVISFGSALVLVNWARHEYEDIQHSVNQIKVENLNCSIDLLNYSSTVLLKMWHSAFNEEDRISKEDKEDLLNDICELIDLTEEVRRDSKSMKDEISSLNSHNSARARQMNEANIEINKTQLVVIVFTTIQWGFGDLFVIHFWRLFE